MTIHKYQQVLIHVHAVTEPYPTKEYLGQETPRPYVNLNRRGDDLPSEYGCHGAFLRSRPERSHGEIRRYNSGSQRTFREDIGEQL